MKITVLKSTVEAALAPILKMVSSAKLPADFHPTLTFKADAKRGVWLVCTLPESLLEMSLPDAVCDVKSTSLHVNLEMFRKLVEPKGTHLTIELQDSHVQISVDGRITGSLVPMPGKDAFAKLALEAKFQLLSPGGAISYVEVPDMKGNIEAVLAVVRFIYDNIIYAELNTKSDYCQKCGWDGEIQIVEQDGKLVWKCPRCGNTDQATMNVARRTCGYIGTQFWNQGRTQEIRERVLHL